MIHVQLPFPADVQSVSTLLDLLTQFEKVRSAIQFELLMRVSAHIALRKTNMASVQQSFCFVQ